MPDRSDEERICRPVKARSSTSSRST